MLIFESNWLKISCFSPDRTDYDVGATVRSFAAMFALFFLTTVVVPSQLLAQTTIDTNARFRTVMISGGIAPGMPDGITLSSRPGTIVVGAEGKVAFIGELRGSGVQGAMQAGNDIVPNDRALYVETDDGLKSVVRLRDSVLPDQSELQVFQLQLHSVNNGEVLAVAQLGNKPRIPNSYAIVFTNQGDKFVPVMETGVAVAKGSLKRFDDIQRSAYSENGLMTFRSRLQAADSPPSGYAVVEPDDSKSGSSSTTSIINSLAKELPVGLWTATPTGITEVVQSGQSAPGLPAGHRFGAVKDFVQNANGNVAFVGSAWGDKNSSFLLGVWFVESGGEPRLVSGEITGLPEGAEINSLENLELNDADQIVVQAGYTAVNDSGKTRGTAMVLIDGNESRVLIKSSDIVPTTDTIVRSVIRQQLSSSGLVAVHYEFGEDRKTGLMLIDTADSARPTPIMTQGNAAPGVDGGVMFGKIKKTQFDFLTNNTVVFFNRLSDKSNAVFLSRNGAPAQPLVVNGMEIEIQPDDKRTIQKVNQVFALSGTQSRESGFLPMHLKFTDRQSATVVVEVESKTGKIGNN